MKGKQRTAIVTTFVAIAIFISAGNVEAETFVRFDTIMGDIDVMLYDDTPLTRDNFLNYVNSGDYTNSIIHRLASNFVIQGGGFTNGTTSVDAIPTNAPVLNEFSHSNLRGTIAMAKNATSINSATSQWFFNLADNSANLDNQNGGFTAFGEVVGNGMDVVDAIAILGFGDLDVSLSAFVDINFSPGVAGAFTSAPLFNYTQVNLNLGELITPDNLVVVNGISVITIPEPGTMAVFSVGLLGVLARRRGNPFVK